MRLPLPEVASSRVRNHGGFYRGLEQSPLVSNRWKSSGGVETNELPFGPSRRDSNPCFSLERARPWVVFSPTSLPGATARCHSRARSAPGIRRLFVDLSWSTKSRANTKFRFLRLTAAIRSATQRDQWASLGRGLS